MHSEKHKEILVPETLDGWSVLHELYSIRWADWKKLSNEKKEAMLSEASEFLKRISKTQWGDSACFSMLGHKADLMFVHFRNSFDELNSVELEFKQLGLADYLVPTTSYVSVVELGLYAMTMKLEKQLLSEGLVPDSDEWQKKWSAEMADQKERMKNRLYPTIPEDRYLCFYPMNKKREGQNNWYTVSMAERQRMMMDHGMIGRKYAGQVTQIISGSIGYDDWEWGVDLFAKEPLVFKKLIYEMRFDEASALYADFGPFYVGMRFSPEQLKYAFHGQTPSWSE